VHTAYRTGEQARDAVGDMAGRVAQLGGGSREVAAGDGADDGSRPDLGVVPAKELPIAHYEELTAQRAIAAVRELTDPDDLETVIVFEERHKNRLGVLTAARTHRAACEPGLER
jgi:hypothetical protein